MLIELYDRIPPVVHDGRRTRRRSPAVAPVVGGNSIGWLLWHLIRVQDHHMSEFSMNTGVDDRRLVESLSVGPDPHNTGYGHTADDVGAVRPTGRSAHAVLRAS